MCLCYWWTGFFKALLDDGVPTQRRATEPRKKMLRWAQTANFRCIYYTVGQQKWCVSFVTHKRELVCRVLVNLLSDWRCREFKTGKNSNNYSAWKELGGDPIEASTLLQSGWRDMASLYKPGFTYTHRSSQLQQREYCSFYQGASSSFDVHVSAPFVSDRKPGNVQKLLVNNSVSTSVKTCTFRNPAGVCGHRHSHLGTCWCQFVHCQCFQNTNVSVQTCAALWQKGT